MYSKGLRNYRVLLAGWLFAAFLSVLLLPNGAAAHAPSDVKLDYDLTTQTLQTTIKHTRFSDSHYIDKVEIRKNGNLVNLQEYKIQSSETFLYPYKVTAAAGDVLEVKVYCNRFGSKTEKLKVGQAAQPASK